MEAFSKREMHKNFSLLLFEGVPLPPSLPFTPFSQETEKYFWHVSKYYMKRNYATFFTERTKLSSKIDHQLPEEQKERKNNQPKQNTKQNKTKRTNLHNFDAYNLKLYFLHRDEVLHRSPFPSSLQENNKNDNKI